MSVKCILIISILFQISLLQAELLIFKKTADGFLSALKNEESLKYGPMISKIILKYQWPMCTISKLTKKEQEELLIPGISDAEEIFIQRKINEIITDLDIQVTFFPTTLYELHCIYEFVNTDLGTINREGINFSKNSFERATMTAYFEGLQQDLRRGMREEIRLLNRIFGNFRESNNQILNQFGTYNQLFFDTTVKYLIGPIMQDKKPIDLFTSEDISAYMYMNNKIIKKLIEIDHLFSLKEQCFNVSQTIEKNSEMILKKILEMFRTASYNEALFGKVPESMFFKNTNYLMFLNHENLIKSFMDAEYRAKSLNKAMLLRGTDLLNVDNLRNIYRGVKTSKGAEEIPAPKILGTTMTNTGFNDNLYSVSFGQSLFAGIFFDKTACAFYFLKNSPGYVLLIDKKEYVRSGNNGLFFIPPLSTIAALFGFGEFFHPRTKVPLSTVDEPIARITGFSERISYHPLLFVIRNPLVHAEMFSEFVALNGIVLNLNEKQAVDVLEAQKELSDAYSNTRKIKKYLNQWRSK